MVVQIISVIEGKLCLIYQRPKFTDEQFLKDYSVSDTVCELLGKMNQKWRSAELFPVNIIFPKLNLKCFGAAHSNLDRANSFGLQFYVIATVQ